MPKWILYVPVPGSDDEVSIPYEEHEERSLEEAVDSFIVHTALDPVVRWL